MNTLYTPVNMRCLCHTHPLHTLKVSFSASLTFWLIFPSLSFCPSPFPYHPAFFYLPPSHILSSSTDNFTIPPSFSPFLHRCSVPLTLTCFPLPSSPYSLCITPSLFSSNLHPSFSNRPVPSPLHPIHPVLSLFLLLSLFFLLALYSDPNSALTVVSPYSRV